MPGRRDHLQLVGGRRFWVRPQPRMQVATQAIFAGPQEHRVFAMTPEASGRGYGHVAVRVGRVLVYLEDRQALEAWTTAISKAADLQAVVDHRRSGHGRDVQAEDRPPPPESPRAVRRGTGADEQDTSLLTCHWRS